MWRGTSSQFWFTEGVLAAIIIQSTVFGFLRPSAIEYVVSVGASFALVFLLIGDYVRHRRDECMLTIGAFLFEWVLDGELCDQWLQFNLDEDDDLDEEHQVTHLKGKDLMAISQDLYNIKRPTELYFFLTGGNR